MKITNTHAQTHSSKQSIKQSESAPHRLRERIVVQQYIIVVGVIKLLFFVRPVTREPQHSTAVVSYIPYIRAYKAVLLRIDASRRTSSNTFALPLNFEPTRQAKQARTRGNSDESRIEVRSAQQEE